jgi:hypothetical protein
MDVIPMHACRMSLMTGSSGFMDSGLPRIGGTPARGATPTESADLRHMCSVGADGFAALSTRRTSLVSSKLMGFSAFMGRPSPFASNFTLPLGTH